MSPSDLHALARRSMQSRGLRPAFSNDALLEAEAARHASPAAAGDIRDLRALSWFSIDNDDTLDLDQLSVAELLPGGAIRLLVAIADVDAYVRAGGPMDAHAAANTTSVYTAAGVFPMLPEALSNDLTSLHEGQERLAVVADMQVQPDGLVGQVRMYRAAVFNQAKLTYDAVAAWLEGTAGVPATIAARATLQTQVRLHDGVAGRLRQWRHARGALEVQTVSPRPVFRDGVLVDLRADARNRAKDLIADLMIATNGATARFLVEQGFPSLRRSLRAPKRWDRLVALAAQHGAPLPAQPDSVALDAFLGARRAADPAEFADLSLAVVKLLGAGEYAVAASGGHAPGHFGLAVADYAHTTAPNRRFPDLVMQRLVKAALSGDAPPYAAAALADIAAHCTAQEAQANKVEREVLKAAGAWLLQHRVGQVFDAIVTGAAPKGTFVRLASPLLEGRVVRGFEGLDVGDAARVRLLEVDPERSHIDFERVAP